MKTLYKIILCLIGLTCFGVLYHYFDPAISLYAPKCPFWLLTGYKCPGCGSQRAIHQFLNGHLWEGIRQNYLLLPSLIYVILLLVLPRKSVLYQKMSSITAAIIIMVIYLVWWVVRNLIDC